MSQQNYSLLQDRSGLTARQSMECLLSYAREQDERLRIKKLRVTKANLLVNVCFIAPPVAYLLYHTIAGTWRSIYPTTVFRSIVQVPQMSTREYFAPEIYLKDQERMKYQIQLKELARIKKPSQNKQIPSQ